ncbi:ubiquitin thioesterase OTU1 isoform X2 [Chelonus insularis]|uniref:ubiquitin thioesterase OTU1 isoform X2 n=1 Tax=Chelonus insularis TaxID=460826 RepID=UPI0015889445|nr:ubiquitin thioesterase OTU1 isoform X2 [Chelonus insularis]
MNTFLLRIKTKSGHQIISTLLATDTVYNLKVKLTEFTGIESKALHILYGFPPKVLEVSNDTLTLKEVGIMSGETLIVEEKSVFSEFLNDNIQSSSHLISDGNSHVPGTFIKKVVPADNSCLFTSIGYVIGGKINSDCSSFMREIIANTVAADPEEYSEALLSKPNKEYCKWILKPESWGGGIELSILSKFYGLEIVVVNSVNGNINRFGEDQHYAQRVFLIFDGIHYDPLYMESPNMEIEYYRFEWKVGTAPMDNEENVMVTFFSNIFLIKIFRTILISLIYSC